MPKIQGQREDMGVGTVVRVLVDQREADRGSCAIGVRESVQEDHPQEGGTRMQDLTFE
jgi:hypothetical protein